MAVVIRRKRRRASVIILALFLIVLCVVTYYQLLYKSPRVDNGVASMQMIFDKHRHIVTSVRFGPGDSLLFTSSVDSTVRIWKRESGEIVKEIKHPTGVAYMDLSNDGNYIVTGGYD
jgi:WD40 repeat protein